MNRARWFAIVLVAGLVCATSAHAEPISIIGDGSNSTENLGRYTGTLSYTYSAADGFGDLSVVLMNTTPTSTGGFLTAFLFNVRGDAIATLHPNPTGTFWKTNPSGESGSPYGIFEAGAALDGDKDPWGEFLGGGSPVGGLAVGASQEFHFRVTGTDASKLTTMSFLQDNGVGGSSQASFLVRFKGTTGAGSDKVGGTVVQVVPLPTAAWGGMALISGMGLAKRFRRRLVQQD